MIYVTMKRATHTHVCCYFVQLSFSLSSKFLHFYLKKKKIYNPVPTRSNFYNRSVYIYCPRELIYLRLFLPRPLGLSFESVRSLATLSVLQMPLGL